MFFQNPFTQEFRGSLVLGDRQASLDFIVPSNKGRGDEVIVNWAAFPLDFSGNDSDGNSKAILVLRYATDAGSFRNWTTLDVNITTGAVSNSAVTAIEAVASLNGNAAFAAVFLAAITRDRSNVISGISIKSKLPITRSRFYVENGRAESVARFNDRAGVAELPSYFARHTVDNFINFPDSIGLLIELDNSGSNVDESVIDTAKDGKGILLGYDHTQAQADWQLFSGRSGIFQFTKVVDSNTKLVYSAGAKAGDLAMMTVVNSGNTFQLPYTLVADDLITPP